MKLSLLFIVSLMMTVPSHARRYQWSDFDFTFDYSYQISDAEILEEIHEISNERYGFVFGSASSLECNRTWYDKYGTPTVNPNQDLCDIEYRRLRDALNAQQAYWNIPWRQKVRRAQHVLKSVRQALSARQSRVQALGCLGGDIYTLWNETEQWYDLDSWHYDGYSSSSSSLCEYEEQTLIDVAKFARYAKANLRKARNQNPYSTHPYESAYNKCIRRGGSVRHCRKVHGKPGRPLPPVVNPTPPVYETPYQRCVRLTQRPRHCRRIHLSSPAPVTPLPPIRPIEPIRPIRPIEPIRPIPPVRPTNPVGPLPPIGGGPKGNKAYQRCLRRGKTPSQCRHLLRN